MMLASAMTSLREEKGLELEESPTSMLDGWIMEGLRSTFNGVLFLPLPLPLPLVIPLPVYWIS